MTQKNVMVFIEQSKGKIAEVSLELLCEGRRLAQTLNVGVDALVLGHNMKDSLPALGGYGVGRVFYVEDKRLAHFTSVPYAKMVASLIKKHAPQIVLFGATIAGRDIAPRVASELGCGLTADCTELKIGDFATKEKEYKNILMQIRPAFGGNIVATIVSPESTPSMATVREGVMRLDPHDSSRRAEVVNETCHLPTTDFMTEVLKVVREEKTVNLKAAKIIVAAGMGAANNDSLRLVKDLASVLGGEVGTSRPVVDGGFMPRERQVGQTGVTVRPNLYIACGISGQIQHRAGMAESKRIIAINNDPNAPIFAIAHYGIVGDLNEILPRMIEAYKAEL